MPDYSGTILGNVQTITDGAVGYLKIPVSPLLLGALGQLIGLLGIGFGVIAFRRLLSQFRNKSKPDTKARLRKTFSSRPILVSLLLAVLGASLAILIWTFPLLGPRCAVFLPLNGPEGKFLGSSGLTHYFNFVCMPFDPSLVDPNNRGLPAFLIGSTIQIICLVSLIAAGIMIRKLYQGTGDNFHAGKGKSRSEGIDKADSKANTLIHFARSKKGMLWTALGLMALISIGASLAVVNTGQVSKTTSKLPTESATPSVSPSVSPSTNNEVSAETVTLDSLTGVWERPSNSSYQTFPEGLWLNIMRVKANTYLADFITASYGQTPTIAALANVTRQNGKIIFSWLDGSGVSSQIETDGSSISLNCENHLTVQKNVFNPDKCNFQGKANLNFNSDFESALSGANLKNYAATNQSDGLAVLLKPKETPGWFAKLYDGQVVDSENSSRISTFVFMDLGYQIGLIWWGSELPKGWGGQEAKYFNFYHTGIGTKYFQFDCSGDPNAPYWLSDGSSTTDCEFFEDYVY
ncbi:MAG: hypothetical protein EBU96_09515 [Actinobacteria bacterium]|nr:hypothetical protein [Actinomycetota bacterium]